MLLVSTINVRNKKLRISCAVTLNTIIPALSCPLRYVWFSRRFGNLFCSYLPVIGAEWELLNIRLIRKIGIET